MRLKLFLPIILLAAFVLSCKDKNVDPADDSETNHWVYDQMKYWYYWTDHITTTPDYSKSPADFFQSLLYKYDAAARPDGDRFSWMQASAKELEASLGGESKTSGMEYKLVYFPVNTSNVIGVVLFVIPDSPAAKAGFVRGDIFSSVNGQKLTDSNYSKLLNTQDKANYTLATIKDGVLEETATKRDVTPVVLQEDPVFFDSLYTIGDSKIGYVVYHQFIPEPYQANNKAYDRKLDALFSEFKNSNVNALVLDLRYNPGGYVSSAINMASLMTKATANDVFYYKEYNKQVTETNMKKYGEAYFYDKFAAKSQNIGPGLKQLVVLVSSRTASASELVINGLKPFMAVTIVGGRTVGKNVGSVTLSDEKKGIRVGLQPIVSKSYNKDHKSDYQTGFEPDVKVNEGNILYPYGDPRDPLLGEALFQITGTRVAREGRNARVLQEEASNEFSSTISRKAGGSNMFFDR